MLGEEHPDALTSMKSVALMLHQAGDMEGALRLLRKCVIGRRKIFGNEHARTVVAADLLKRLEAQRPTPQ